VAVVIILVLMLGIIISAVSGDSESILLNRGEFSDVNKMR